MKRILFVDDETRVLEGLQRMLRPMRHTWAMQFAPGGQQALEILTREPVDILVTDMRMPGMDGAELLSHVRERYPRTIRIILTGQASREAILRSVRVAHRQLNKPCDAETLKANVLEACALRDLLGNEAVMSVVSRIESVPSLPATYLDIEKELESPDCSLKKVGQIIDQDVGMAVKILQIVNSSFFGLRNQVESPSQAVVLLGLETIQSLVLGAHVFCKFDQAVVAMLPIEQFWNQSQLVSALAKQIARAEQADKKVIEYAGMAGLLHNVGKLVLANWMPASYQDVLLRAREKGLTIHDAEREVFGTSHAEVGAYLLGLWGLPDAIVEAVAWQHRPEECQNKSFGPLTAVHVAGALAQQEGETVAAGPGASADLNYLGRLGLGERLPAWCELARGLASHRSLS